MKFFTFDIRKIILSIPFITVINNYSFTLLRWDLIAGVTLAAFVLPESMAYASLAGVPAQLGIYACMAGALFFALFTTSKQVAVGPTSAISLMVGTTVAVMSGGDIDRWIAIASLTALVVFVLSLITYVLRLSILVNFISDSILVGFKTGAALTIMTTQLPKVFGIEPITGNFFVRVNHLLVNLGETNGYLLAFGCIGFLMLIFGDKIFPGRPIVLIVMILSIVIGANFGLEQYGIHFIHKIPEGLPTIGRPSLRFKDIDGILGLALGCFLMAYIETISVAKTFAEKHNYTVNPQQELLSLGAANFSAAFAGGFPVSGGLSQSAVNDKAGAKTQISLLFCTAALAIILIAFTGIFEHLPEVVLALVVLHAAISIIKIKELKRIFYLSKSEFTVAMIAILSVLIFGILKGVLISAIISIMGILALASMPNIAVLGRIPRTRKFSDISRHKDNIEIPGIKILRIESSLFYFNVDHVSEKLMSYTKVMDDPLKIVILDMSASPYIDIEGSKMLKKFVEQMHEKHIAVKMVDALSNLRDLLRKQDVESMIGKINRYDSIAEIVEEYTHEHDKKMVWGDE